MLSKHKSSNDKEQNCKCQEIFITSVLSWNHDIGIWYFAQSHLGIFDINCKSFNIANIGILNCRIISLRCWIAICEIMTCHSHIFCFRWKTRSLKINAWTFCARFCFSLQIYFSWQRTICVFVQNQKFIQEHSLKTPNLNITWNTRWQRRYHYSRFLLSS